MVQAIAPSSKFVAVTPSDTVMLSYGGKPTETKALYVGTAGDVAIKNKAGTAVTFSSVPAGSVLPVSVSFVMSTNTTATNIVALF